MLERDQTFNDIWDRIEQLEDQIEDLRDVSRPTEVVVVEQGEWQALAGWVSTGSVLRDVNGRIVLDPTIPRIQIDDDGYIESADFVTGVSGFQINGGTAEFNDVVVRGTIYADVGQIGGWDIAAHTITADAGGVGLNSEATGGTDIRIWAGHVTPSSAPFRVDENGALVASDANITGTIDANAGHIGSLDVDGVLTVGTGSPVLQLDGPNKRIQSSTFVSGVAGMRIEANGNAEFNNVRVRGALTSTIFVKGLIEARAGSLLVVKSAGALYEDMAVPGAGTWSMKIEDPPTGGFLFENSDICRCKSEYSGGIGDIWFVVSARVDNGDGTQSYTCTYSSGTRSITYPAGAPVLDYGVSGDGGLFLTADDGDAPFLNVFTHAGAPWSTQTEHLRLGNLNGLADFGSDAYGVFIGDYAGDKWMSYDPTNSLRIRGDALIEGTLQATKLAVGIGQDFFSQADGLLLLGPPWNIIEDGSNYYIQGTRESRATLDGAIHLETGRWQGTTAIVVEEGRVNYCTNPRMYDGNDDGQADDWDYWDNLGSGGNATLEILDSPRTERGWLQRMYYTAVVGDSADTVCLYHRTPAGSFAANDPCTLSIDVRGEVSGCNLKLYIIAEDSGNGTLAQVSVDVTPTPMLTRYSMNYSSLPANTDHVRVNVCVSSIDNGDEFDLEFGATNIEKMGYDTSFIAGNLGQGYAWTGSEDGSTSIRTRTDLAHGAEGWLNLLASQEGSFIIWFQMPMASSESPLDYGRILEYGNITVPVTSDWFSLYFDEDGDRVVLTINRASDASSKTTGWKNVSYDAGEWLCAGAAWDSTSLVLYWNGEEIGTISSPNLFADYDFDDFNVLSAGTTYLPNAMVGLIATFGAKLDAQEFAKAYVMGRPIVDLGSSDVPGIYIYDGKFGILSNLTGMRVEIVPQGMGIYDDTGYSSVGRLLGGRVNTTTKMLDPEGDALGWFGYDDSDNLQVAWYGAGTNKGKIVAGGGNIILSKDHIELNTYLDLLFNNPPYNPCYFGADSTGPGLIAYEYDSGYKGLWASDWNSGNMRFVLDPNALATTVAIEYGGVWSHIKSLSTHFEIKGGDLDIHLWPGNDNYTNFRTPLTTASKSALGEYLPIKVEGTVKWLRLFG